MSDRIWPTIEDYDLAAVRALAALAARGVEARMVGSYARRALDVPYSDIDVLATASEADGARVRDIVIDAARAIDGVLCVTVDPFAHEAIVYSVMATGLQIDWFVVERAAGEERPVWRGELPPPVDVTCRAWSSLLSTLSSLLRSETRDSRREAARDLAEHWVWLSLNGVDVSSLMPCVPSDGDNLRSLIVKTANVLPHHRQLSKILHARLNE